MRSLAILSALAALCASSPSGVRAWTIATKPSAPVPSPTKDHQTLTRTFNVSSGGALDALYLALPGRVFVEIDPSALAEAPSAPTEAPPVPTEAPPAPTEAPPVPTDAPSAPTAAPPAPPTETPSENVTAAAVGMDYKETLVAWIEVTGDSAELLDLIEAVPLSADRRNGLKLRLKNADAAAAGFLVTTVGLLDARSLTSITSAVAGDVVVDARAVAWTDDRDRIPLHAEDAVSTNDVSLSVEGPGRMFVVRPMSSEPTGGVSLGSLSLRVAGSGSLELGFLTGAHVELSKAFDMSVDGSGAVRLAPDAMNVPALSGSVSGSGVAVVESMGSVLISSSLDLSVSGSGSLSLATGGAVDAETISLSGSGQLLAGSIKANTAAVTVHGSGLVIVQAVKALSVSTSLSGAVGYINGRPAEIEVHGGWFWRSKDHIAFHEETNTMLAAHLSGVPPKLPVYRTVRTSGTADGGDPHVQVEDDAEPSMGLEAAGEDGEGDVSVVSLAAVAVAVAGVATVAVRAARRFRLRRQYTQLL